MNKKQKTVSGQSPLMRLISGMRNRMFKDRLFKRVFREKKYLLELYNALNNSNYPDERELEVVTMEDVVFLKMKNDLSFIIGNTLNLYEHQSTLNGNITLRVFLYFARHYEMLAATQKKSIYGRNIISLPFPQCVILYNGNENVKDACIFKLSDTFTIPDGKDIKELIPAVECTVRMININYGHNKELMHKCRRLDEYSQFIQIVKYCDEIENNRDKAMEMAVDKGIEQGLLTDILVPEKVEVKSMLLTEFDEKKYKRTLREEGREDGIRETLTSLVKKGLLSTKDAAEELGISEDEFKKLMQQVWQ